MYVFMYVLYVILYVIFIFFRLTIISNYLNLPVVVGVNFKEYLRA